ncbi:hypothetical protein [Limnohabitans sp.]
MHVAITMGMTLEQVREQFDIPRLLAFNQYCEKFPPLHVLVAAYFGYPKEKPKAEADEEDMVKLMAQFAQVAR